MRVLDLQQEVQLDPTIADVLSRVNCNITDTFPGGVIYLPFSTEYRAGGDEAHRCHNLAYARQNVARREL